MKGIALAFVVVVAASGCKSIFSPSIQGSGKSDTKEYSIGEGKDVPMFKRIETSGAFNVELRQGDSPDLKVTGDDNLVKLVDLKVVGDTLQVRVKENYSSEIGLSLSATVPDVEGISINGSGSAKVSNVSGDELDLQIHGSGDITATGTAKRLAASISGSGTIEASAVESANVDASISGSGTIRTHATENLAGSVAGSGEIRYKGSPKVSKSISGSGDIEPL